MKQSIKVINMKNITFFVKLLIILLGITSTLQAQTEQKQFLLGGQYGLNYSSNTTTFNFSNNSYVGGKSRSLGITPQIGYFIFHNSAIGLEFRYNYDKEFGQESQGYSPYNFTRSYSFIPFLRYYFGSKKIKPYLHAGVGPGWQKTGSKNYQFPESTQKTKLFFYELKGGLAVFFNEHISFDFGVGYESTKTLYKESMQSGSSDEWNVVKKGINSTIGIVVYI